MLLLSRVEPSGPARSAQRQFPLRTSRTRAYGGISLSESEAIMGLDDKIKHGAEDAKGKLKETSGKATGNDKMEAEGKVDQTKADVKQAGDDVKDAFKE